VALPNRRGDWLRGHALHTLAGHQVELRAPKAVTPSRNPMLPTFRAPHGPSHDPSPPIAQGPQRLLKCLPKMKNSPLVIAGGFFVSGDATALATNSRLGGSIIRRLPADVLKSAHAVARFPLSIPQIAEEFLNDRNSRK
jgi:hypothetical protein